MALRLEELGLDVDALDIAKAVQSECPWIQFSSGARSIRDQARAMAQNTVQSRSWIINTYKTSDCLIALVGWLNANKSLITQSDLELGFLSVLEKFSVKQLQELSKHIVSESSPNTAKAFDIVPVSGNKGKKIVDTMNRLAKKSGGKFLQKEGGLIRWHFQL